MKTRVVDLIASVTSEHYYSFVKKFWPTIVAETPKWNWHMEVMCDEFQALMERVFLGLPLRNNLVCNCPPGTTKSLVYSVFSMPWIWTRMPSARGIFASYSEDLAVDLSVKARDVVRSDLYQSCFPKVQIRQGQDAMGYFQNTDKGWRYSIGVKGMVFGRHAHVIVVDDPIDPRAASSEKMMAEANHWMTQTLPSRKVDKLLTPTVLVMQRLRVGDPSDVLLSFDKTRHVCLPAEVQFDDSPPPKKGWPTERAEPCEVKPESLLRLYRHRGDDNGLMDPVRLSREALWDYQQRGGYSGQFLQRPRPDGEQMFMVDRLRYADTANGITFKRIVRSWDKAGTSGAGAWTAGVKLGLDYHDHYWVLDVVRGQWDSYTRERRIRAVAESDGRDVLVVIEEEPSAGGKQSAEITVRNLAGFRVKAKKVGKSDGDKVDRADGISVQVNAGNVTIVRGSWNQAFVNELERFPASTRYKDQVDALANGERELFRKRVRVGGMTPSDQNREEIVDRLHRLLVGKK